MGITIAGKGNGQLAPRASNMAVVNDTKTALVTGANKGIGFAISEGLSRLGFKVVIGARDE